MGWITPKTDWKDTDYFNKEDYNRIAGNLLYLKGFVKTLLNQIIYFKRMGTKSNYTDFLEPSEVNNFQHNLKEVNDKTERLDIGSNTTYTKGGYTPDYTQWNRIESFTLQLHDDFVEQTTSTRLTQKLGNTDSRRGIRI